MALECPTVLLNKENSSLFEKEKALCIMNFIATAISSKHHSFFSDLFPLGDEEDQHDKDFLKDHDEDVEDTLSQPRCALHWLSYTHRKQETTFLLR